MISFQKIASSVSNNIQSTVKTVVKTVCSQPAVSSEKLKVADIPSSSIKAAFMPVTELGNIIKIPFKDKETGKISDAVVEFIPARYKNLENVIVKKAGKTIAQGEIRTDYLSNFDKDFLDLGIGATGKIKELGNCVYINMMQSYTPGAGTVFHKAVAMRSQQLGFDGRVALDAAWSSHPFHLKSGFIPLFDDAKSKYVVDRINEELSKAGGNRINTNWVGGMDMILTPENAQKLLEKPV